MSIVTFEIVFPIIGCAIIAVGLLMALFPDRANRVQRALDELTLLGRWTSASITPKFTRTSGIILASFGGFWLLLVLVIFALSWASRGG